MLRLVLMWILVIAVPVQAFAATAMAACHVERHQRTLMTSDAHDHMASQGSDMAMAMDHQQSVPAAHTAGAVEAPVHQHIKAVPKCSACGACCASSVTQHPFHVLVPIFASVPFNPFVSMPVPAFLTAGIERPPRTSLA